MKTSPEDKADLTLAELAENAGIPARTIRFYIAKGLLEGPKGAGRGAAYDSGHARQLERIGELKSKGHTLSEIRRLLQPGVRARVEPSPMLHYRVSEDVTVTVRSDSSPWRLKQVQDLINEMHRKLREEPEETEE